MSGMAIKSINSGTISTHATFADVVMGGEGNEMSTSAIGASANVSFTTIGASNEDRETGIADEELISIDNFDAQAENSGDVAATGIYTNARYRGKGKQNKMSVQAAGVSISITARNSGR